MAGSHKTGTPSSDGPEPVAKQVATDPKGNGMGQRSTEVASPGRSLLDPLSVAALREFFQLLDDWDRSQGQNDD